MTATDLARLPRVKVVGNVKPLYELPSSTAADPFGLRFGYGKQAGPGLLGYDIAKHTMQPEYLAKYAQERGLMRSPATFNLLLTAPAVIVDCYAANKGVRCMQRHEIPAQDVADYCRAYLGMIAPGESLLIKAKPDTPAKPAEPEVVIQEVMVVVETPLALSFDERAALVDALHRAQHIENEYLRRAMVNDDAEAVAEAWRRLNGVLGCMEKLGIEPEPWTENLGALVEAGLVIPDAQPTLFG